MGCSESVFQTGESLSLAARTSELLFGGVLRDQSGKKAIRVSLILVEQFLELRECPFATRQTVHVDPERPDQFEIIMIACRVFGRAGARVLRDLKLFAKGLSKSSELRFVVQVFRDLWKPCCQFLNRHRLPFYESQHRLHIYVRANCSSVGSAQQYHGSVR